MFITKKGAMQVFAKGENKVNRLQFIVIIEHYSFLL